MPNYSSVPFSEVNIFGNFWSERLETVLTRTIPSQLIKLEATGIRESISMPTPVPPLRLPRTATGFTLQYFWDSDIGKWIEAASYALSHRWETKIETEIELMIDDLEAAQAEDGYLNCFYLQHEPDKRWTNLRDNHELYNAGHLLEGAVAYFQVTGKDRLMLIMERYIDHIAQIFGYGPNQKLGFPGHQEIEIALIRAWRVTHKKKFLDLAIFFIDVRGKQADGVHYFDREAIDRGDDPANYHYETYEYAQAHLPVREQNKVVGHAVRAMYMYTAMAELAGLIDDKALKQACETLWQDVTTKRMYVTGGFGASDQNEGFTNDYDLPNDTAYAETCASVAMVFWASRMLNLDRDGRYADTMELALYNNVLSGLSKDGMHYFYDNKLESDGTHHRWDWHECPCCTMNVSRLIASVAGYFYSYNSEEVAIHLYGGSQTHLPVGGSTVTIKEKSNYPWEGKIEISVDPEITSDFTVSLRVPGWCEDSTVYLNGNIVKTAPNKGYISIHRTWTKGDLIEMSFPMLPKRIYCHPGVRHNKGRVALRYGPLIYAFEQHDNDQPINYLRLPTNAPLSIAQGPKSLGDVMSIKAPGKSLSSLSEEWPIYSEIRPAESNVTLTAIPYFLWCNRGANPMQIWLCE